MKPYLFIALLCISLDHACADTLTTPSFVIDIRGCEEGVVSCDNVVYTGTSKKTGKSIRLHGRTLHTLCADGVTPCRFLGYEFRKGDVYYRVLEDGRLLVMQGKKILVDETGEWD